MTTLRMSGWAGLTLAMLVASVPAAAIDRPVASSAALIAEIGRANPGDVITVKPGAYAIGSKISVGRPGRAGAPITVRAAQPGTVILRSTAVELFFVKVPYWRFENLTVEGVCASDTTCEHAFHIVGAASFTTLRGLTLRDFNASVKGNGDFVSGVIRFPSDVVIEASKIYNRRLRSTGNPVHGIDVVGGDRWRVRGNLIGDIGSSTAGQVSYQAQLKGNGADGVFARNLVVCSKRHAGGVRIGLSFGGGGSGPDPICGLGSCATEHRRGIMRNNVVMSCNDAGMYLNEAPGTRILASTTVGTTFGVDVRFTSTVRITNSLIAGPVRNRDGGTSTLAAARAGLTSAVLRGWFVNPTAADFALRDGSAIIDRGLTVSTSGTDLCLNPRNVGAHDLGPIEYGAGRTCTAALKARYAAF